MLGGLTQKARARAEKLMQTPHARMGAHEPCLGLVLSCNMVPARQQNKGVASATPCQPDVAAATRWQGKGT